MAKNIQQAKKYIKRAYGHNKYVQSLLDQLPCADDCDIHADKVATDLKYALRKLNK